MRLLLPAIAVLLGFGTDDAVAATTITLPSPAFAESCINTGIFRRDALLTVGTRQVIAYFTESGSIALVRRLISADRIEAVKYYNSGMSKESMGDGHQSISVGFSEDGFLHLIWGCHDTPDPKYLKLRWSDLETVTDRFEDLGVTVARLSYPQFHSSSGGLLLFFRRDSAPSGHNTYDQCLALYDLSSGRFNLWHQPLVEFPAAPQLAYFNGLGECRGTLATAYTIRRYDMMDTKDPAMKVKNQSFRLLWSRDMGRSWSGERGRALSVPIKALDISPSIQTEPDENLVNQGGGVMEDANRYWFSYFRNDSNGVPQIFAATFNLKSGDVSVSQVSKRREAFDMLGRGTQRWPISRPALVMVRDTLMVIYRSGQSLVVSARGKSSSWASKELFRGDLGNYEPIIDYTRCGDGVLSLYVQYSQQGPDDTAASPKTKAHPFILELKAQELRSLPPFTG